MEGTLTAGAIEKIVNGEVTSHQDMAPVLQVTLIKHYCSSDAKKEGDFVMLHDGTHSNLGLLGKHLKGFVTEKFLKVGTIVRLTQFVCNNVQEKKIIINIYQLEVMTTPTELLPPTEGTTLTVGQVRSEEDMIPVQQVESSSTELLEDSMSISCESYVPCTQESDVEDLKANVLKSVATFRQTLADANIFIHNTRVSKDEIRAMIRCFSKLVDDFQKTWNDFRRGSTEEILPLALAPEEVRPQADDSEELSSDKLRLIAASLLKYFRKSIFKSFVMAFTPHVTVESGDDAKKALRDIKPAVEINGNLVYLVMNEGFDCRDRDRDVDEEEDDDDDLIIQW